MIKDIKYQGYSAVPSDYECLDGELAASYNLIPEDGAMHPIMPPTIKFTLNEGEQLLWIHKMIGHTHYILMVTTTSNNVTTKSLKWVCEENGEGDQNPWTRHDITGSTITGTPTISSIGNTLIVNDDNGVQYFLWSTESSAHYEALGQKPPMLEITFGLHSDFAVWPDTKNIGNSYQSDYRGTIIEFGNLKEPVVPHLGNDDSSLTSWAKPKPVMEQGPEYQQKFAREYATYSIEGMEGGTDDERSSIMTFKSMLSQSVFARLNSFVNEKGTNENKFVLPFFVRYGYRLYDGSYIRQSYPVLMIPNSRGPMFALDGVRGLCLNDNDDNYVETKIRGRIYGCLSELVYTIASIPPNLTKWKDLITSVDIGVSAPIYTYDQAGDLLGWTNMDAANDADWEPYYTISKVMKLGDKDVTSPQWAGVKPLKAIFQSFDTATRNDGFGDYFNRYDSTYNYPNYIATIPLRKTADVNKSISNEANFHIIKEFSLDELATCSEASLDLEDGVLGGLLGRKTMTDDYHSHDNLKASLMYNFNGRMNYASVERTPHTPLKPQVQFAQASASGGSAWQVAISIKNEMQTLVVQSEQGSQNPNFPHWIYYPDANAKFAYIKHSGYTYELKLTPHELLNGAYWLGDITQQDVTPTAMSGTAPTPTTGVFIEENKVYTSEINNPFYIPVTGINTVGTGKILAITAAVKALSQGQFGQFPLYAFTTEGVWALETSSTGSYIARQPVTRDVCTNANSITQLDDAVIFATDRGIMMLSGATCQCISDIVSSEFPFDISALPSSLLDFLDDEDYDTTSLQLLPFSTFLSGCRMIYDYTHQRIIVYNTAHNYAYVYSLKDHKWGLMTTNIDYGINSYPDALAVTDDNHLVNLSDEVAYETVDNEQVPIHVKGLIITRPLKLDAPDALKTIDTIIQRGKFNFLDTSRSVKPVRSILFGSRDLYNWMLVRSSTDHNLRGFSGTPYKYFRIILLVDFLPDESIYGCTLQYTPRYLNRPR